MSDTGCEEILVLSFHFHFFAIIKICDSHSLTLSSSPLAFHKHTYMCENWMCVSLFLTLLILSSNLISIPFWIKLQHLIRGYRRKSNNFSHGEFSVGIIEGWKIENDDIQMMMKSEGLQRYLLINIRSIPTLLFYCLTRKCMCDAYLHHQ